MQLVFGAAFLFFWMFLLCRCFILGRCLHLPLFCYVEGKMRSREDEVLEQEIATASQNMHVHRSQTVLAQLLLLFLFMTHRSMATHQHNSSIDL